MNDQSKNSEEFYQIVAIDDSYKETKKVYVKIKVKGTGKVFNKSVDDLFTRGWLEKFSKEDVAQIAFLFAAETEKKFSIIPKNLENTVVNTPNILFLGLGFSACIILSNLASAKMAVVSQLHFQAGLIFFPLTYLFDDLLTEVYGFKVSRRVIWMGFISNLIVILGIALIAMLPSSPYWPHQKAFEEIYQIVPRVFVASFISYLIGQFTNSIVLARLKILTSGKHLWLRVIGSTAFGVGVENTIFVAFTSWREVPTSIFFQILSFQYFSKVGYEILALPLTYMAAAYLKRVDKIDYYDRKTNFNPFSLRISD